MPDPCQTFRDEVRNLQLTIAGLQDELRHASPTEKPGLIKLIREAKAELAQSNRALAACEREHPPSVVVFTTETCPVCTPEQLRIWRNVADTQLGVDGFDPVGHWIGGFPAERFANINNWYPLSPEKQVLCGQLHHFNFYDGVGDEADWNNFIIPSPAFAHILEDPKIYGPDEHWHTCINQFDCMEAEITPDESYYENVFNSRRSDQSPLEGQTICTYGPWVRDSAPFHSNRPEIHPSELYWWRARLSDSEFYFMLMLVQDDSNRFDRDENFDFGFPWDAPPDNWRAWSQDPRAGTFMIAFELDPTGPPLTFSIRSLESLRTNPVPGDQFALRTLEYNGRTVVTVREVDPATSRATLSFGFICRNAADTRLQGYVAITVAAGQGDRGGEGYQTLRVDVNRPPYLNVDEAEIKTWPLLAIGERPARAISLQAVAQPATLRRAVVDGRPQLHGDIEIRVEPAPGSAPTDQDLTLTRAESIVGGTRRKLVISPVAPRRNLLRGLPVGARTRLNLTTGSGSRLAVRTPALALAPQVVAATVQQSSPDASAWDVVVRAAGGRAGAAPPPVPLVRVSEWQLAALPLYAPVRDGQASAEDESPFTEEINDALLQDDAVRLQKIFGTREPVEVQWAFRATDLTTGKAVAVQRGAGAPAARVRVEELPIEALTARTWIRFPEQADGKVYEVIATATMTDVFGFKGTIRQRVSSHVLALDDRTRLASLILPTAATLADVRADDLLAAASLGQPLTLGTSNAPRTRDLRSTRAQMVRLSAMAAAENQRIDVEDLRVLIRGARLFGGTRG